MGSPSQSSLILSLVEAAAVSDYGTWLGDARQFIGAASAILAPLAPSSDVWLAGISSRVSGEREAQYRERFHLIDTWLHRIRAARPGQAFTIEMLMPEAELLHSEFYSAYMVPSGYRYRLGTIIEADGFRFLLSFWRQKAQRDFTPEDCAAIEGVAPFLRASLRNHRRRSALESHQVAFRQLINQYSHGAVMIDGSQRVLFFNKVAGEYVGSEDSLAIREGQLVATNPLDQARFASMLKSAVAGVSEHGVAMLKGVKSGDPAVVSVITVPRGEESLFQAAAAEQPAAIVLITRGARSREVGAGDLESMWGFTPNEAQIASLLVAGWGVTEIASKLSIGRETVRYFLKSLFAKTGTHSQRELVSFIGTSLPPQVPAGESNRQRANGD